MKMLKVRFEKVGIDYDSDYGVSKRSGWSFIHNGSCIVELTNWFVAGCVKLLYYMLINKIKRDYGNE